MYSVVWTSDKFTERYNDYEEWDMRIDEIAETEPYDIDVDEDSHVAYIDDGDFE